MISITLKEAIANAEKASACKEDLDDIKSLGSIEAVLKHKKQLIGFIGMLYVLSKVDGLKLKSILRKIQCGHIVML